MRSWHLVDGERHAIGCFGRSATAVDATANCGIGHRNRGRTRSGKVRVWNCGHELGPAHMGGGQRRAFPIDRRGAGEAGAVYRKYDTGGARIRIIRNERGNVR